MIHKTEKLFSAIGVDRAHEQINALMKGDGGAIVIMENESALLRWMVSGPDICRPVGEYEERRKRTANMSHHEDIPIVRNAFLEDVQIPCKSIEEFGNPFLDETFSELLTLDSKAAMDSDAVDALKNYIPKGTQLFGKTRQVDLEKFFRYEDGNFSVSVTSNGDLYCGTKPEKQVEMCSDETETDAVFIEGAHLAHAIRSMQTSNLP